MSIKPARGHQIFQAEIALLNCSILIWDLSGSRRIVTSDTAQLIVLTTRNFEVSTIDSGGSWLETLSTIGILAHELKCLQFGVKRVGCILIRVRNGWLKRFTRQSSVISMLEGKMRRLGEHVRDTRGWLEPAEKMPWQLIELQESTSLATKAHFLLGSLIAGIHWIEV